MIATGGRRPGGILVRGSGVLNDRALSLRRVRKTTSPGFTCDTLRPSIVWAQWAIHFGTPVLDWV